MAIMQDRKGFMWFGTWDGLNKFDGYEFTIYKSHAGDHSNIATNRIDYIHEDKFGYIWFQTYDGKIHRLRLQEPSSSIACHIQLTVSFIVVERDKPVLLETFQW